MHVPFGKQAAPSVPDALVIVVASLPPQAATCPIAATASAPTSNDVVLAMVLSSESKLCPNVRKIETR
jgi:hypothetical protein